MKPMNIDAAAEFLFMSVDTLRDLATSGEVAACKPGKAWVFLETDLLEYIQKRIQKETAERRGYTPAARVQSRRKSATPPLLR